MKRFRVTFKSKAGNQYVTLMARNRGEAEVLAAAYQTRRGQRRDITFSRLEEAVKTGKRSGLYGVDPRRGEPPKDFVKAWAKSETERRKRDFSRYDAFSVDDEGNTIVDAAEAPLTLASVEEVK